MSYTNTTEFYNIPLPGEEDLVNPMDDNDAKEAVDTALHGAVTNAENAVSTANSASDAAAAAVSGLEDLSNTVNTEKGKLTALTARVTAAENEIDDVRSDTSDMICAFNEPSATSRHAYSIGDFFIYNNVLYKATAPIAINDTIVPNTNCDATNVTYELLEISGKLTSEPVILGEVTANGVKTRAQLFNELFALCGDKITSKTFINYRGLIFRYINSNTFTLAAATNSALSISAITFTANSAMISTTSNVGGATGTEDLSSNVEPSGNKISLCY